MCCLFVESYSPTVGTVVNPPMSGSQLFQACHRGVWWVIFCSSFILAKCLSWLRTNYVYADDSTLLAVVCKPAERSAVAASLNRNLARIQEWCNHWCIILNPYKTYHLIVSRLRTVNPPHDDLVLSRVPILACPNLDINNMKFDQKLTSKYHVSAIVCCL